MALHKFKQGSSVCFASAQRFRPTARGAYQVVRQAPDSDGERCYIVKSEVESHDRMARESELDFFVSSPTIDEGTPG